MNESAASRLLADLAAQYSRDPYDPALDVTVLEVAVALGISTNSARGLLDRRVRAGELERRRVQQDGLPPCYAYRQTQKAPESHSG